jgi:hypothetical protein
VAFCNVETHRWDEREDDRRMDQRISRPHAAEITPELASTLQEMMDK